MTFRYKNCAIIMDDGKGCVYKNGQLMFKGDGYIAIKFLLSYTDNAEEVKEYFGAQLNQREKCRWQKNDEKEQLERKMKEEAEKAKNAISVSNSPRTKRRTKSTWEKLTR